MSPTIGGLRTPLRPVSYSYPLIVTLRFFIRLQHSRRAIVILNKIKGRHGSYKSVVDRDDLNRARIGYSQVYGTRLYINKDLTSFRLYLWIIHNEGGKRCPQGSINDNDNNNTNNIACGAADTGGAGEYVTRCNGRSDSNGRQRDSNVLDRPKRSIADSRKLRNR